ncbi:VOC family protein [Ramlibacter sp.]|uniref:VOC family protein n=1 Tax=Ramlibacter sp. TaxID=1917967 RepID=UPI001795C567|nr:VOC family protein [Ramlibacter sp.]MBA2672398.1 VOC family protein [Ramlibacter sp.]
MKLAGLDHVVLTVRDMRRTIDFYCGVLGMRHEVFEGHYDSLHFGSQKINLHPYRGEYLPHADITVPGSGDFCFVCEGPIGDVVAELHRIGHPIELGPVPQTGARGAMQSVYIRDPDGNLLEIASYDAPA